MDPEPLVRGKDPDPDPSIIKQKCAENRIAVKASDCQCQRCKSPGFDPSILRHKGGR
jgi:hypothetical protein